MLNENIEVDWDGISREGCFAEEWIVIDWEGWLEELDTDYLLSEHEDQTAQDQITRVCNRMTCLVTERPELHEHIFQFQ